VSRWTRVHVGLLLAALAPGASAQAQQTSPPAAAQTPRQAFERVVVTAGRSTVLTTDFNITRIAVTNPAVADAVVVQPREILVDGKAAGTVSLIVWGAAERRQYDIVVEPPVSTLQQQLQALFPGEDITVRAADDALVLTGHVSSTAIMLRAGELATAAAPKATIINMLQVPGGSESQQVMLQVRIAEVNRRALTELGVSFFTSPIGINGVLGRTTTQQFAAPDYENLEKTEVNGQTTNIQGEFTFSDFLNIFLLDFKRDIGAIVRALQTRGFVQSLAEPNLIAYNGQEASFLAGGEIPIPVVNALGQVTIQYKEFGVRLNFTPTIAGDVIRLKVRPEVSTLDFPNGITLAGFRIPALATRRAETDVELRDGQSFAIAGLLDNLSQDVRSKIPLLGDLPIIGPLFRSKGQRAERTELMVLITPRLVRPLDPDEVPPLPTMPQEFLPPAEKRPGGPRSGSGIADGPPVGSRAPFQTGPKPVDAVGGSKE
jgi:pilus assembly protein CpaC